MLLILNVLQYYFQPAIFTWFTGATLVLLFLMMLFFPDVIDVDRYQQIAFRTVILSFIINLYLNLSFYPSLLKYQAGSEAGVWVNANNPQNYPVKEINYDYASAFEFYCNAPISLLQTNQKPLTPFILYASADDIKSLSAKGWHVKTLNTFQSYWVSRLKPAFLNRATRDMELTTTVVALVN